MKLVSFSTLLAIKTVHVVEQLFQVTYFIPFKLKHMAFSESESEFQSQQCCYLYLVISIFYQSLDYIS